MLVTDVLESSLNCANQVIKKIPIITDLSLAVAHQVIPANHQMQRQDDPQSGKDVQMRIYGTEIRNFLADHVKC